MSAHEALLALAVCDLTRADDVDDVRWARSPAHGLALALVPVHTDSLTSPTRDDLLDFSDRVDALWRQVDDLTPMRFGAGFHDLPEARELLETRAEVLSSALESARGRVEFSLRVPLPEAPAPRPARSAPPHGAGAAYLLARRDAHARQNARARRLEQAGRVTRERLEPLVSDLALPSPKSLSERDPDAPIASLSLLVARDDVDALTDAVATLGPPHELFGPLPCYSFAAP